MNLLFFFVALTPVLLVMFFLVILRLPATTAMPLSWLIHALLAIFIWRMPLVQVSAASLEGIIIAISVLWIIFGAIFLLNILKTSGAILSIRAGFNRITADRRVQAVLIAYLFGSFLEGASGFGTPAAICAPFLVALGFPLMAAVVLSLVSNSIAVSYGSAGTTFLVGLTQGLQQGVSTAPQVSLFLGQTSLSDFVQTAAAQTALLNLVPGIILPLVLSVMLTRFWGKNKSWCEGLAIWKFALLSGFIFAGSSALIAGLFGPDFPSLLGSMIALIIMIPIARKGWLLPKTPWRFESDLANNVDLTSEKLMPLSRAVTPYILATIILLLTRLRFLPFKEWLNLVQVGWDQILGTGISTSFAPLYSPGAIFTLTGLVSFLILGVSRKKMKTILTNSAGNLFSSAIALGAAVPLVRIFINSGVNQIGLESMPIELAASMALSLGTSWPLIAPFVGAMGAFISGSATFSNLMFSLFQFGVAVENNLPPATILALQSAGAALGNMICVVNVVAASSVVGLVGKEGKIIRFTLLPSLIMCLIAAIVAMILYI